MKPESIEARKEQRKRSAVRGVLLFALLQLACAVCFGALCFIPDMPGWCVILFGVLAALFVNAMLPGGFTFPWMERLYAKLRKKTLPEEGESSPGA